MEGINEAKSVCVDVNPISWGLFSPTSQNYIVRFIIQRESHISGPGIVENEMELCLIAGYRMKTGHN